MPIKLITFDFYNTLGRFNPSREQIQIEACRPFGLELTPAGISSGYRMADAFMAKEVASKPLRDRSRDEVRAFFTEYERIILQGNGIEVSREITRQIMRSVRSMSHGFELYEDVLESLEILKMKGLTLGMISNNEQTSQNFMAELGLQNHLDFAITSSDVGTVKPHSPIFIEALNKANVNPYEGVYVGDQYETDIKGALRVGMEAILIDRDGLTESSEDYPVISGLHEVYKAIETIA